MIIGITGISGFLGSHLIKDLRSKHKVINFHGLNRNLITSRMLREFEICDFFLHLAEPSSNIEYTTDFSNKAFHNSRILSETFGEKLIYMSSVLVYGLGSSANHHETDSVYPFDNYTFHKVRVEKNIRRNDSRIIRVSNLIGLGMHPKNLINNISSKIRHNERIIIDFDNKRDFIDVRDASKLITDIIEMPSQKIINIGTGRATSISQIIKIIARILKSQSEIQFNQNESDRERSCIPDVSLLHSLFPEFRYTPLLASVKSIVSEEQSEKENYRDFYWK